MQKIQSPVVQNKSLASVHRSWGFPRDGELRWLLHQGISDAALWPISGATVRFDGSTFDLWVLSANRLVLVPQMKASIGAIKRIVSHVFDNYAEGHIGNFEGQAA